MIEWTKLGRSVEGYDPKGNSRVNSTGRITKITNGERENEL